MKDWRTTTAGIISAVVGYLGQSGVIPSDIAQAIVTLAVGAIGFFAADK